jgi:predicted dehydrogenase
MIALVVGNGRMGRFHGKVLADLGYDVVTVDPIAPADYAITSDALRHVAPDVAAIACPPQHLEEEALKLVGTPMLVEKPFALTRSDAVRLAWKLGDTPCCVGFVERFNPQVRTLRQRLEGRTIHAAQFVRQSERPSPDVLLDLAIHDADLAAYLGIPYAAAKFEAAYGGKKRSIKITHDLGTEVVDLRDHDLSPLHGLWHAFLSGGDYPTPHDAIKAHEVIAQLAERVLPSMSVAA